YLLLGGLLASLPVLALQPPPDSEKKGPAKKEFDKKGFGGFGPGQRRKILDQFDKDGDGRLNAEERKAAREFLEKQGGGRPPFGPGPGGPGGPGGPPGGFLAKPLLDALDADKDGKLSNEEFLAGVTKFFKQCDKDGKGRLDEKALSAGLNRLI